MENIFLTSLTIPEVRQVFRQELEKYFTSKKIAEVLMRGDQEDELDDCFPEDTVNDSLKEVLNG